MFNDNNLNSASLRQLLYLREQTIALIRVARDFENEADEVLYRQQLERVSNRIDQLAKEKGYRTKGQKDDKH